MRKYNQSEPTNHSKTSVRWCRDMQVRHTWQRNMVHMRNDAFRKRQKFQTVVSKLDKPVLSARGSSVFLFAHHYSPSRRTDLRVYTHGKKKNVEVKQFRYRPGKALRVQGGRKGKVHPCTGTEALYRPYDPYGGRGIALLFLDHGTRRG